MSKWALKYSQISYCPCKKFHKRVSMLLGKVETPPTPQQSTPPDAEANRLKVLITGLVPSTVRETTFISQFACLWWTLSDLQFTADKKQSFKKVTADLMTQYCSVNNCTLVNRLTESRYVIKVFITPVVSRLNLLYSICYAILAMHSMLHVILTTHYPLYFTPITPHQHVLQFALSV